MKKISQLLPLFFLLLFLPSSAQNLQEGFENPPISARPKGYWVLVNGNFSLSKMTEELKAFKDKGMGGVDLWDVSGWVDPEKVIPAGPPFMGDQSVQAIAHGIREGKKLGLEMGLTISSSWNAGGDWIPPEHGIMGIFNSSQEVVGPHLFNDTIAFPKISEDGGNFGRPLLSKTPNGIPKFYKEVAVLAYPITKDAIVPSQQIIDLSKSYKDGILRWEVPFGKWKIVRYITTGTGQPLKRPSPNANGLMIDHFSKEAQKMNLEFIFDQLEKVLGKLSISGLSYLYTDSYEANSSNWTTKMSEEFKKRNGYAIEKYLPALWGTLIESKEITDRFLFDFRKTLSDLIIENHYAYSTELCKTHGLGFIAEAGGPGPPVHNTPFESIKALGSLTVPRGEFWFDPLKGDDFVNQLQVIKGPASAAHLYGQPKVEAEAYTGTQLWQFGPGDLKSATDRALCEGLTGFIYHTTPHIPDEAGIPGWVYNFGTIINTTRIWWPKSANFHEYIARSSFLLQQGNFIGDVLYYYGDETPNFVDQSQLEKVLDFGYDYDVTNSEIILDKLEVKNAEFVLPHGQNYKVLVLPDDDRMQPKVLEKIEKLIKKGGIVIGDKPSKSYGLVDYKNKDMVVASLADKIWAKHRKYGKYGQGSIYTKKYSINEVLQKIGISKDVSTNLDNPKEKLDYIHRKTDAADIYFIRNKTDKQLIFDCTLRSNKGTPELWNPVDGSIQIQPIYIQKDKHTTLPLLLKPLGSVFIVLRNKNSDIHVSHVQRNKVQIFPSTKKSFGLAYINNEWLFDEAGTYELTFDKGRSKIYNIDTVLTPLTISGPWELRFPYGWGTPQRTVFEDLISWTDAQDDQIKYFSGVVSYHKTFKLDSKQVHDDYRLMLDLGEVSKVADVYLNGRHIDVLWHSPFQVDITHAAKEGDNHLVIEIANVMNNRLVGDAFRKKKNKRTHTNITKGPNAWNTPFKDHTLIKSGLMGPVRIFFSRRKK